MGIGLVYPKFAAHHNLPLLLQIKFIRFSLYKVNIGCPATYESSIQSISNTAYAPVELNCPVRKLRAELQFM